MAWTSLKAVIANTIKTNGTGAITGQLDQDVRNALIDALGENATYAGVAVPSTVPGTPDGPVFYLASEAGTYSNFGGTTIPAAGVYALVGGGGTSWVLAQVMKGSDLAKGVFEEGNIDAVSGDTAYLGTNEVTKEAIPSLLDVTDKSQLYPNDWILTSGGSKTIDGDIIINSNNLQAKFQIDNSVTVGEEYLAIINYDKLTALDASVTGFLMYNYTQQIKAVSISSGTYGIVSEKFTATADGLIQCIVQGTGVNDTPSGTPLMSMSSSFICICPWSQELEDYVELLNDNYSGGRLSPSISLSSLINYTLPNTSFLEVNSVGNKNTEYFSDDDYITEYNSLTGASSDITNEVINGELNFGCTTDYTIANPRGWAGFQIGTSALVDEKEYVAVIVGKITATNVGSVWYSRSSMSDVLVLDSLSDGVEYEFSSLIAMKYDAGYTDNGRYNYFNTRRANSSIDETEFLCQFSTFALFEKIEGFTLDQYVAVANDGGEIPTLNTLSKASTQVGKKLVTLGDSITYQSNWQDTTVDYLGYEYNVSETRGGFDGYMPMGVGGATVRAIYTDTSGDFGADGDYSNANGKKGSTIHSRARDVKYYNPDTVIILGGQNDGELSASELGTIDDDPYFGDDVLAGGTEPTFYASYKGMLEQLSEDVPLARLVCMTTMHIWHYNTDDADASDIERIKVRDAIIECAELYGCTVVDLWANTWNNISAGGHDNSGGDTVISYIKRDTDETAWQISGARAHPNEEGGKRMAELIVNKLR